MSEAIEQVSGGWTVADLTVTGLMTSGMIEPNRVPYPQLPPSQRRLRRLRLAVLRVTAVLHALLHRRLARRDAMRVVVARRRSALRATRWDPPPMQMLSNALVIAPGAPSLG